MHDKKKGATLESEVPTTFTHTLDKSTHRIDIGIKEENRQAVIKLLQTVIGQPERHLTRRRAISTGT